MGGAFGCNKKGTENQSLLQVKALLNALEYYTW